MFLILHDIKVLKNLDRIIMFLTEKINANVKINILISSSSEIKTNHISPLLNDIKYNIDNISTYEDEFFDYSAYLQCIDLSRNYLDRIDGGIFINDTIFKKHQSTHLLKEFSDKINLFLSRNSDFKFITGPYGNGEFIFEAPGNTAYIPTYCFFISANSFIDIRNIIETKTELKKYFTKQSLYLNERYNKYTGFFEIHRLQLKNRNLSDEKIINKLITAILEREISYFYIKSGLLMFCDYGIKNQLVIKIQKKINFLNKW